MEVIMPKNNPTCDSQKQHVSISIYAYNIIHNDSLTFKSGYNDSGIINDLITSYQNNPFTLEEYPIVKDTYDKKELKIRLNKKENDKTLPFNYLYEGDAWKKNSQITRQGEFIRRLIETYAHSTFFRREEIYYWRILKKIKEQIRQNAIISVSVNGKSYTVKPYRLSNKQESSYNYLIGFSRENDTSPYIPASFRLSRIADTNTLYDENGDALTAILTPNEINTLDSAIRERGVEYLIGKTEEFEVLLSKRGKGMFDSMYHLRPTYIKNKNNPTELPDGNEIIKFNCTRRQIRDYFFRFGADAIILSPRELRDDFFNQYLAAEEAYRLHDQ